MHLIILLAHLLVCTFAPIKRQQPTISNEVTAIGNPIGINLAAYNDYSPEFLFNDVFKSCRPWTAIDSLTGQGNQNINIPLRPTDGYPTQLPYDRYIARTYVLMGLPHGYPAGRYRLRSSGNGRISLSLQNVAGSRMIFNSPIDTTFQTDGTHGVIIELLRSDPNNPIRDIQFLIPRTSATFNRQLLAFVRSFDCIRWMDLMRTNSSPIVSWNQRTLTNFYTQADSSGVAYEYLIQLNNVVRRDAWVNIPHKADDNFITQFATLLRDQLNPNLNIYVEYSNEVWNPHPDFRQHLYAQQQGQSHNYPGTPADRARRFYAKRSADVFAIFDSVFQSGRTRLIKVLASQAGYFQGTQMVMEAFHDALYNPRQVEAHALAIAPYLGNAIGQQICNADSATLITTSEILSMLESARSNVSNQMLVYKNLATLNNLMLLAYEGGQHLSADGGCDGTERSILEPKLNAANRDERMGQIYCQYLQSWFAIQGGLFMHYGSHSRYNRYSWGLKEYIGQPDSSAHKYGALMNVRAGNACN